MYSVCFKEIKNIEAKDTQQCALNDLYIYIYI